MAALGSARSSGGGRATTAVRLVPALVLLLHAQPGLAPHMLLSQPVALFRVSDAGGLGPLLDEEFLEPPLLPARCNSPPPPPAPPLAPAPPPTPTAAAGRAIGDRFGLLISRLGLPAERSEQQTDRRNRSVYWS